VTAQRHALLNARAFIIVQQDGNGVPIAHAHVHKESRTSSEMGFSEFANGIGVDHGVF
jgi:hypothetical protein